MAKAESLGIKRLSRSTTTSTTSRRSALYTDVMDFAEIGGLRQLTERGRRESSRSCGQLRIIACPARRARASRWLKYPDGVGT